MELYPVTGGAQAQPGEAGRRRLTSPQVHAFGFLILKDRPQKENTKGDLITLQFAVKCKTVNVDSGIFPPWDALTRVVHKGPFRGGDT